MCLCLCEVCLCLCEVCLCEMCLCLCEECLCLCEVCLCEMCLCLCEMCLCLCEVCLCEMCLCLCEVCLCLQTMSQGFFLQEAQLSHIRQSVEAERAVVAAREAQQLLAARRAQLEQQLVLQHQDDPQGLELAR